MAQDISAYILEKLANFKKFLDEMFAAYPAAAAVKNQYAQLSDATPELFVAAIRTHLSDYDGRVDEFVDLMARTNKLDLKKFRDEHVAKFKRYIQMFIDLAK